ncbi:MAG: helix-turn-helix domain-containing protein, partial [Thermoplasmatota archaeon]
AGLAWLGKPALTALFSRLRRNHALDSTARRQLMAAIEAEPGIHLRALVRRSGQGSGAVRHHVAKLVHANLVVQRKAGGYLCLFPADATGSVEAAEAAASGATKADGARRVLRAVAAGPAGVRPLAARAGLAPSTVEHHLVRLSAAGLVQRRGAGFEATRAGTMAAARNA